MAKNEKLSCSYQTKLKMADSLKALMRKMSFDKISVLDITDNCGIHRQTFYYHFNDKYELLEWILNKELIEPLADGFSLDTMYDKFEAMFTTMKNDKSFFKSAFKVSDDEIANYINGSLTAELSNILKEIETDNDTVLEDKVDEIMLSRFISCGIAGVVSNWAQHGMKESPEHLINSIRHITNSLKKLVLTRM